MVLFIIYLLILFIKLLLFIVMRFTTFQCFKNICNAFVSFINRITGIPVWNLNLWQDVINPYFDFDTTIFIYHGGHGPNDVRWRPLLETS